MEGPHRWETIMQERPPTPFYQASGLWARHHTLPVVSNVLFVGFKFYNKAVG